MRYLLFLFVPLTIFTQQPSLDPELDMENINIPRIAIVKKFIQEEENPLLIYQKEYYREAGGMKTVYLYDYEKRTSFYAEYSEDSLAYGERLENNTGHTIHVKKWEFNDEGELEQASRSQLEGKHIVIFNTNNDFSYDNLDRLEKIESSIFTDLYDYNRKKISSFKYNENDSLTEEKTIMYKGIFPMLSARTRYTYDIDGLLIKKVVKMPKYHEVTTYEYNGIDLVEHSVTQQNEIWSEKFYEYNDSVIIKLESYSKGPMGSRRNCNYYNSNGILEIEVKSNDSIVYQRYPNDSLKNITRYITNSSGEIRKTEILFSQKIMNGFTTSRKTFTHAYNKIILDEETYLRNEKDQIIKYIKNRTQNTQEVYELVKTYTYDSQGILQEVTLSYPMSKFKKTFYYELSYH